MVQRRCPLRAQRGGENCGGEVAQPGMRARGVVVVNTAAAHGAGVVHRQDEVLVEAFGLLNKPWR